MSVPALLVTYQPTHADTDMTLIKTRHLAFLPDFVDPDLF